jgi:tetratricopeptide (TPR) repeat protein
MNTYIFILGQTISSCMLSKNYIDVGSYCREYIGIVEKEYSRQPNLWKFRYAFILSILGISYKFHKNYTEAISCFNKSIDIYKISDKDVMYIERFVEMNICSLNELKEIYIQFKNEKKAKIIKDSIYDISKSFNKGLNSEVIYVTVRGRKNILYYPYKYLFYYEYTQVAPEYIIYKNRAK